jgi:diguanylate cyclase (GGDEF)-like protein
LWFVGIVGAMVVAYVAWTWGHWWGDPTVVSDVAPIPVAALATVFAWRASRGSTLSGRVELAWRVIAVGCGAWTAGECTWFYLEVIHHAQPFPSVADVFYLTFYPCLFVGLALFPLRGTRRDRRMAFALDTATVMIASAMAVWYLVIAPTVATHQTSWFAEVLSLAYPAGDLILVLGVARVLLGNPGRQARVPLWFLVCGVSSLAVADVVYARLALSDTYASGTVPDVLWIIGLFALTVAGFTQTRIAPPEQVAADPSETDVRVSKLPYLAVAAGLGLLLYETTSDAQGPLITLVVGALALTGVVVWRQITVMRENERLVRALHDVANTDGLTGLLTRRRCFELGGQLLTRARHDGQRVAALMIDIDRFKAINDRAGHAAGDDVIHEVARRCALNIRDEDLFGRYGGDEFVLLVRARSEHSIAELATRLAVSVAAEPFPIPSGVVSVTLSIGTAITDPDDSLQTLLDHADTALYRAKRAGRNQHAQHPTNHTTTPARSTALT